MIEVLVRRFKCSARRCPAVTFAEQIAGLTSPHARFTPLQRARLTWRSTSAHRRVARPRAEPVAHRLADHSEVEIACRDRDSAYSEAARPAAPQAIQVVDVWHVWHNLAQAVAKCVTSHYSCHQAPEAAGEADIGGEGIPPMPDGIPDRDTRQGYRTPAGDHAVSSPRSSGSTRRSSNSSVKAGRYAASAAT
nr:hypothetical protein HEP87_48330 [Streptomyces sp. S1D4-11]